MTGAEIMVALVMVASPNVRLSARVEGRGGMNALPGSATDEYDAGLVIVPTIGVAQEKGRLVLHGLAQTRLYGRMATGENDFLVLQNLHGDGQLKLSRRLTLSGDLAASIGRTDYLNAQTTAVGGTVSSGLPARRTFSYASALVTAGAQWRASRRWTLQSSAQGGIFTMPLDQRGAAGVYRAQEGVLVHASAMRQVSDATTVGLMGNVDYRSFDLDPAFTGLGLQGQWHVSARRLDVSAAVGAYASLRTRRAAPQSAWRWFPVGTVQVQERLQPAAAQAANLELGAGVQPYYDAFLASLDPRLEAWLRTTWKWSEQTDAEASLRWLTPLRFHDGAWVGARPSQDAHVGILSASVGYRLGPYLRAEAGGSWVVRQRVGTGGVTAGFRHELGVFAAVVAQTRALEGF